jgi:hypothetical protein
MEAGRNQPCTCGSGEKYKRCCEAKDKKPAAPKGLYMLIAAIVAVAAIGIIPRLTKGLSSDTPASSSIAATVPAAATPAPGENTSPAGVAETTGQTAAAAQPVSPSSQPPGPAPAGKVWSPEHGHWHDATPASPIKVQIDNAPSPNFTVNTTPAPPPAGAPPGAAPPGKVWSAEHGHWHDAPVTAGVKPAPLAPGRIRVMGQEIDADPAAAVQLPAGSPQPGPAPPGKVWSVEHGHWHDVPTP